MTEELLDIVDENDRVIGRETRTAVHERGLLHRGVHVWLFTPDGRLLVQQRSATRKASPSSLDGSVSEHVQAGEDYLAAAQRGLREELGLQGVALRPVITFRMDYDVNDREISCLFQGEVPPAPSLRIDPEEVASVEYRSLPALQRALDKGLVPISYWFAQLLRWAAGQPSEVKTLSVEGEFEPPEQSG